MSFSFGVPSTPSDKFAAAAAKAKADLEASSEGNDYSLTQLASDTADAAVKAAVELAAALGEGNVTASISGHHATDGKTASTASASVTVTPVAK